MADRYKTARAFRAALEERLKREARERGTDLMRLRRGIAFDRLLARLFTGPDAENPPWLLKGGYTFELRLANGARTTKDLDLSIPAPARIDLLAARQDPPQKQMDAIRDRLQDAAERNLGDWFVYRIGVPMVDLDAAPYGGARFPVDVLLDVRTFSKFHLDVGVGDAVISAPEWLMEQDSLAFAGIPPARIAVLPREQQLAEKLHAYTLPRGERANTRVKDLVDMELLIKLGLPEVEQEAWAAPYAALAAECELDSTDLHVAFAFVSAQWRAIAEGWFS
jgi:nucleotidyltransferase AbiEii toxin of type IV toxin-antitoxin system